MSTNDTVSSNTDPVTLVNKMQSMRMELLEGNGESLELKDKIAIMRDVSKTGLDSIRIMVDSTGVKAKQEIASTLAGLVTQSKNNPYAQAPIAGEIAEKVISSEDLPELIPVEGEMSTDQSTLDYDSFNSK